MQFKSALTWFGLLAVTFTAWPAAAWASTAPQQSQNLLTNPGFEGQFARQADDFQVASGWTAWWLTPPGAAKPRPNFESTDHAERVHSGAMAQLIGSFYDIHTAGVYQQATVKAGDDLRLSAYGKGWTSEKDAPLNVSVGGTDLRMRIGIDPFGGVDPASPNVVWSEQVNAADSWYRFEVYARAQSNTVTIFVYSSPKDPRRRNYVFWDDAELVALTGDAAATAQAHYPTPTPTPIVYTPTPETVALGQNLLQNPGFEGRFYTPCTWKADPIPWNHIPCDPWYGKEIMTRWNTVLTPESWAAWWRTPITDTNRSDFYTYPSHCPKGAPEGCKAWHNPEYSGTDWIVAGPRRIRSDKNSLRYFTFWSVHEAGVFQ
ncbi:MAG TPA: hypothetical protein VJ754_00745, partial [Anaerolineae bacterium]|nr:hypothetical protein [Anaerolineae bacterium]